MSAYQHGPHDRGAEAVAGRPILFDDCRACEDHAEKRGLGLDPERFREAWYLMIDVEYGKGPRTADRRGYRSGNEAKLCRALYETSLVLQRMFGLDPRLLVVV